MDESEKMLLENLKNFDFKKLLTKKSYVDIQVQDNSRTAFIIEEKENDKFEVNIEGVRGTLDVPINIINFYSNFSDDNIRQEIIYQDLVNQRPEQIISYIKEKLTIFNVKLKKIIITIKKVIIQILPHQILKWYFLIKTEKVLISLDINPSNFSAGTFWIVLELLILN